MSRNVQKLQPTKLNETDCTTQSQANLVTEIKKGSTWMLHEWEALKQCLQPDLLTDGSGFLPKHRVSPQHSETCKARAVPSATIK